MRWRPSLGSGRERPSLRRPSTMHTTTVLLEASRRVQKPETLVVICSRGVENVGIRSWERAEIPALAGLLAVARGL